MKLNAPSLPLRIVRFYRDGFLAMTLGRTLWLIILLKLLVMFGIIKLFFFPSYLQGSNEAKSQYVSQELTERIAP